MIDPTYLRPLADGEEPTLNLCGSHVGTDYLEIILEMLRLHGRLRIENCGGVMNLIKLGACLARGDGR